MARDGYHPSPDLPSPSSRPESRNSPSTPHHPLGSPRSNQNNNESMRYQEPSPVRPAVFEKTHPPKPGQTFNPGGKPDGSDALPPEVLTQLTSQITANVLQQLKAAARPDGSVPAVAVDQTIANGAYSTSSSMVQPSHSPTHPADTVYTPPSPLHPLDEASRVSPMSPSRSTATTAAAPGQHTLEEDRRPPSRSSRASHLEESQNLAAERPKPTAAVSADVTTLEKIWGPLFEDARPTKRLGQFLRGIALHLVEDYEPKHSLVITPCKMQKFYQDTRLPSELYPWQTVFDDRTSSISRLFREVEAQHHLVQDKADERPDIPGLTPAGFERWATWMILAHPEQEFERLQKAVLDMPICNYDDRKERFPKEISRRLFPTTADLTVRERLRKAMIQRCNISLPEQPIDDLDAGAPTAQKGAKGHRADSVASAASSHPGSHQYPPPPPSHHHNHNHQYRQPSVSSDHAPSRARSVDRERQGPVSNHAAEDAIEEEDDIPTPQPIERERKPYSAQPGGGGGRTFEEVGRSATPPGMRMGAAAAPATAANVANAPSTWSNKLGRSASVASSSSRSHDYHNNRPPPPSAAAPNISHGTRPSPTLPQLAATDATAAAAAAAPPAPPSLGGMSDGSGSNHHHHHRRNSMLNQGGRPVRRRSPSATTKVAGDGSLTTSGGSTYHHYASSPSGTGPGGDDYDSGRHHHHPSSLPPPPAAAAPHYHQYPAGATAPADRRNQHRSSMYEMPSRDRDRDRDVRRYQTGMGYNDPNRGGHYSSDEDYYRSTGGRSHHGYDAQQYHR